MLRSDFLRATVGVALAPRISSRAVEEPPAGPTIAVVNRSTAVSDADLAAAVRAVREQVRRDFAPAWGLAPAAVYATDRPAPDDWLLIVTDEGPSPATFGYHAKPPRAYVAAAASARYGLRWQVTLSHETLELLADPRVTTAEWDSGGFAIREVCDPVQADRDAYLIEGVPVSDFVLPSWFAGGDGPYDFRGLTSAPGELRPGGYISVAPFGGWGVRSNGALAGRPARPPDGRLAA